jgi:hypothetical protein
MTNPAANHIANLKSTKDGKVSAQENSQSFLIELLSSNVLNGMK